VKYRWVSENLNVIFLVFYIPEAGEKYADEERRKIKLIIEKYGGQLSEFHECFTF
jgi:hypothetical protein